MDAFILISACIMLGCLFGFCLNCKVEDMLSDTEIVGIIMLAILLSPVLGPLFVIGSIVYMIFCIPAGIRKLILIFDNIMHEQCGGKY